MHEGRDGDSEFSQSDDDRKGDDDDLDEASGEIGQCYIKLLLIKEPQQNLGNEIPDPKPQDENDNCAQDAETVLNGELNKRIYKSF